MSLSANRQVSAVKAARHCMSKKAYQRFEIFFRLIGSMSVMHTLPIDKKQNNWYNGGVE